MGGFGKPWMGFRWITPVFQEVGVRPAAQLLRVLPRYSDVKPLSGTGDRNEALWEQRADPSKQVKIYHALAA